MRSDFLQRVIDAGGGCSALARKLKVTRGAVSAWKAVPPKRAREIAKITGIPKEVLRPDVFGDD